MHMASRLTSAFTSVALPDSVWKQTPTELGSDGWGWVFEQLLLVSDGCVCGELELIVCGLLMS